MHALIVDIDNPAKGALSHGANPGTSFEDYPMIESVLFTREQKNSLKDFNV
jgi:rubredoxin